MSDGAAVAATVEAGVGLIELARPDKKNAITFSMADAIEAAVGQLGEDPECRGIILHGTGGDLSSGADLAEDGPNPMPITWADHPHARMFRAVRSAPVPVVAVVEGWAVGLGAGLVGAATFAVAGARARFMLPEAPSFGYFPFAVVPYLTGRVRPELVVHWALSGARLDVDEAFRGGLVTHCAPAGEADTMARRLISSWERCRRDVMADALQWLRICHQATGGDLILRESEHAMARIMRSHQDSGTPA